MDRRRFLAGSALTLPALRAFAEHSAAPMKGTEAPSAPLNASAGNAMPASIRYLYIPKPQFWSFDNLDPQFSMGGYTLSFQAFTYGDQQNTFSLDRNSVKQTNDGDNWTVTASQLSWPGQQLPFPGSFEARVTVKNQRVYLNMKATANEKIRGIKVKVHNLPTGKVAQTGWEVDPYFVDVPEPGVNFNYPEYQGGIPVWFLAQSGDKGISFSSLDLDPRPKRFAAYPQNGTLTVDLIVDQDARMLSTSFEAPTWVIEKNTDLQNAIDLRTQLLEGKAGLKRWEDRPDVPQWAREVRLVVTLHGMHWSGYIFNDYRAMMERVKWITDRIGGRKVLFFLAGWEGRYYRTYGNSHVDTRMGGDADFRHLIEFIHQRGAHVMAMFSGNYPSPGLPGYDDYTRDSFFQALPGNLRWSDMRGYVTDWAEIRAGVNEGAPVNPGAPGWRDHLTNQIAMLNRTYKLDGTFLDTQPNGDNDTRYSPLEGLRSIASHLRAESPELLLATESWFDLSLGIVPTSQTPDGPFRWSRKYQRRWAHLSMGEPSRGSTGVHELGHIPYKLDDVLQAYDLAAVAIVEDTIEKAPEAVETVLKYAKAMA
jgi:hypothetical protein